MTITASPPSVSLRHSQHRHDTILIHLHPESLLRKGDFHYLHLMRLTQEVMYRIRRSEFEMHLEMCIILHLHT